MPTQPRPLLHTLIKSNGLMVFPVRNGPYTARWFCATELLSAMGLPVTLEQQGATHASQCVFSQGWPSTAGMPPRSLRNQCGNARRVASVGGLHLFVLLTCV